ncbi:MAG: ABC transporter ATP-binding protein, partial [Caldilineaceae bacterium]|nr:ABC transporter ATP-binding protein [Caldilineaceae bacterium]
MTTPSGTPDAGASASIVGRVRRQMLYLPYAFSLVWASARGWTLLWFLLLVVQGLLPVVSVYLTRALVDGLVAALGESVDLAAFRPVLWIIAAMAGVMLLTELLRSVSTYVRTVQAELVQDHISRLVQAQSIAVDLRFYDSPEYFDSLHRARYEATTRPLALIENMGSMLQNGLTMLAMIGVLLPYGIWLPLALILSSLPAFYVVLQQRLRLHRWRMRVTPMERRAYYYFWTLTARETAAEIRLFDLGHLFRGRYTRLRDDLRQERKNLAQGQAKAELLAGFSALLVTGLTMALMVWRAAQGLFSLGDLALFYQAFTQGQRLIRTLLDNLGEIYTNSLFLGDLQEFLTLKPTVVDPPDPVQVPAVLTQGFRFDNVRFRYPDSDRLALDGFSVTIPAGRITAIVGMNGAGKSTVTKLLSRLYDPESGAITMDGVDLRALALADLRRRITMLFQQPVQYNATAAENIALGEPNREIAHDAIVQAARRAGADVPIERLPQQYATPLGKWFAGGADLSVGEWQRLALARAYLRAASLIVLDEPT